MTQPTSTFWPSFLLMLALPALAGADEGMWTFDNPPRQRLQEVYDFSPSQDWLDRLRLASVRFNDGGSGAFVSGRGLMITNHHVGLGCIQNLSTPEKDLVGDGFLARSPEQEKACPGYEVNVLMRTEDVTGRVRDSVKAAMSDREAGEARKAATAVIENECHRRTGLRCNVVKLYQGGEYHLYSYKKYTDVRLVFAPEQQAAFFGGDTDNFTYPRHDLDVAFFRAWENNQPVKPAAFLPWSAQGAAEGELVFIPGHPGSTSRLETLAQLESERDVYLPDALSFLKRRLVLLRAYSARGPEQARRAKTTMLSLENSQKGLQGRLEALQDAEALAGKAARERELRERLRAEGVHAPSLEEAFESIAAAHRRADARAKEMRYVGFGGSRLLGIAGQIVRHVAESRKPNEVRLAEYIDSSLASLENRLYSPAPIYDDLEEATLTDQLLAAQEALGRDHPFVQAVLRESTPQEVAREAVADTRLKDVEARRVLVKGGPAAVAASGDPMIALARRIDPLAREVRKFQEDELHSAVTRAGERIAEARFRLYGRTLHPDATFTLRLAYGVVKGYPAEGTLVPPFTTFHGLFDRAAGFGNRPPWNVARRLAESRKDLRLDTPLNFVSTADIIGGNSGSPTVNRAGQFVGIVFDGNIQSLAWDYFYTEDKARAVSVDARGILEALRAYEARELSEELLGK